MKILFLTLNTFDKHGGIQTFNKYFMEALDANEYSWQMISLHDVSGSVPFKIYCCGSSLLKFVFRIVQLAKQDTVIVWNHISIGLLAKYISLLLPIKRNILLTYGTEVWHHDLLPRKKRALTFFDEIWTISSFTKAKLISTHKLPKYKFRIFPCCISLTGGGITPSPYQANRFNVTTLMRLDVEPKLSAVYNMLDALPSLLRRGIPVHFTVVGRGNGEEMLRRYVAKLDLQEHVTFTGFVEDPGPYLQHCDLFSMVSAVEGFGIVYLEAMQYGKCCIAAKNCGSEDVVLDGVTGYSVSVNDIPALEAALLKLANDENLRESFGAAGYKHLIDNFLFDSFKKNQKQLLNEFDSESRDGY